MELKCMSRVRVAEDDLLSSFCRNKLGMVRDVYSTVLCDDVNITMELPVDLKECLPSQARIGKWCVYLGGCEHRLPISLSLTYSEDVVKVVEDIVNGVERVVGSTPHNWYTERISAYIPFCKSVRSLVKYNGEIFVKYKGMNVSTKRGYVEYYVSFPGEFTGFITLFVGKYGVKWVINDDFTVTPTDEDELKRFGEFGKEIDIHAQLTARIVEVIIDRSCDLLYSITNFLIKFFSIINMYP